MNSQESPNPATAQVSAVSPIFVCDPRVADRTEIVAAAPRLATLDGARIALIHNGKTHGRELMEYVIDELATRWSLGEVVYVGPPSPGYGGNPDDAAPAADAVMAAISAIGD